MNYFSIICLSFISLIPNVGCDDVRNNPFHQLTTAFYKCEWQGVHLFDMPGMKGFKEWEHLNHL